MIVTTRFFSLIASFLMLFQFAFPKEAVLPASGEPLTESKPEYNKHRTADKIDGVGGSVFFIERPSDNLNEVKASDFGISAGKSDNFQEFKAAIGYCRENPGTKLVFDGGTYYLDNKSTLSLRGCKDILFDGNGSTFIFSNVVTGFETNNCDCVEFRNITFDWDWGKLPLSDIITVRNARPNKGTLDFVFPELEEADVNTIWAAVSQCDPDALTYGAKYSNKEVYVYQNPCMIKSVEKVEKNILRVTHDGCFNSFKNGDTFILRHYVYDTSFAVINNESRNITFDGVKIYGYPGSGFVVNEKSSHFQIINTYIGADPEKKNIHHTSLGADAIHIVNTDGCFNIAECDISGQGDDALNVHDGLGWVKSVSGDTIQLTANAMYLRRGDELNFRDELFNETGVSAKITELQFHHDGTYYDLKLDRDISGEIKENYIASNTSCCSDNYVVRNNYIHENRARGFLLQSANGLCEENRFYKTEMQAIKVVMDISPGLWYEGTGVDRLEIVNNTFDSCDYIATGEVITIGSNIAGKTAVSMPFTNIEITGNRFTNLTARVLNANNVNGLIFSGNYIDAGRELRKGVSSARAYFGEYCSNIVFDNNDWKHCYAGGTAKTKTLPQWARINQRQK